MGDELTAVYYSEKEELDLQLRMVPELQRRMAELSA